MHGLINRGIQRFVTDSYGQERWTEVTRLAGLDFVEFEAMLIYDDDVTNRLLKAACNVLDRALLDLMEDLGTYLVSHPNVEALRRLLRFGGVNFVEFLHSLDDLPDRARLAVSDLVIPELELHEHCNGRFELICESPIEGCGHVLMGALRVMADDYGTLAYLEHTESRKGFETISITLIEAEFAEGRHFDLGAGAI
ncbi:MAG: heme NO-binding domain-containing protein [Pseudomonadota bacterium]